MTRARQRAAAVGSVVNHLQGQLDLASARVDAADLGVSIAAENFDTAQIELDNSRRAAREASAVAVQAGKRLAGARQQIGRLAAQTYRSGGPLASFQVLFSPDGPGDVLERSSMMHILSEQRQHTMRRMDAARVVAATLQSQATQALATQTAAAATLQLARAAAQQRDRAARAILTGEQANRTMLMAKLAVAQRTTVAVEQARQAGLQKAAVARRWAQQQRLVALAQSHRHEARIRPGSNGSTGTPDPGAGSGSANQDGVSSEGGSSSGSASRGESVVSWARRRVGLPYQWGGAGPDSYDCSGLTMSAWQQSGVQLPHSSAMQYRQAAKISYSQLRPGDLIFFATDPSNENTIHHESMYIGGGQMIEAPHTGAYVRIVAVRTADEMPYAGRP